MKEIELPELSWLPLVMVAEIKREMALRRAVYPRQIAALKMSSSEAEQRLSVMGEILQVIEAVFADKLGKAHDAAAEAKRVAEGRDGLFL